MSTNITFHKVDLNYRLREIRKTRAWLQQIIEGQGFRIGEIAVVLCSDEHLLQINMESLDHHYYTDIITFDYRVDDIVSGDLFISVDRVKENAKIHEVSTSHEMRRVCAHGVLHLCGFGDKTQDEAKEMRRQEDRWLNKFHVEQS